jgi:hypothetical protein
VAQPFLPALSEVEGAVLFSPPSKPAFTAQEDLAFSLKSGKLLFMTFSFYSYAWRFTYRNNRVRVASV